MGETPNLMVSLGNNIGLVAVLALVCSLLPHSSHSVFRGKVFRPRIWGGLGLHDILVGALFGVITMLGMKFPVVFSDGVFLDGKTILIPLACFFYGPATGFIALGMAAAYRLHLGGIGAFAGTMILFTGAAIGLSLRYLRHKKMQGTHGSIALAILGIAVAVNALLSTFLLPLDLAIELFPKIWIPVLTLYPFGTLLVGSLLGAVETRNLSVDEIRRKAEELKERNRFIETLVDLTPELLYIYDLVERRNIFTNLGVQRVLGYSSEELKELRDDLLPTLMHPDDYSEYLRETLPQYASVRDGEVIVYRYRMKHASGKWIWMISREVVYLRDSDGTPRQVLGMTQDITDGIKAEQERESLIRNLESKNAELERFTYTVSHDLKAPLITIKGFLHHIEAASLAGRHDRVASDIARVARAADRMETLLADLLELSRVGRMTNPATEFLMDEAVDEALSLIQGALLTRSTDIVRHGTLPRVKADRLRIVEVWQNLFENAVKYSTAERELRLEIGWERGKNAQARNGVFYLRDNGIGIEASQLDRIFGLFEKLDPATEGNGIGLALVRRIVEAHRGRVWAESGPGPGTTFYFTLEDC